MVLQVIPLAFWSETREGAEAQAIAWAAKEPHIDRGERPRNAPRPLGRRPRHHLAREAGRAGTGGIRPVKPVNLAPRVPIDGAEVVYAASQPEYEPLVVWRWPDGTLITRWRLTWRERLAALLGRDLYLQVMTFGQPLQPLYPTMDRREVVNEEVA